MNIILATGIYPPKIGGPATYTRTLAEQLVNQGHVVDVITYAREWKVESGKWKIHYVSNAFLIIRWFCYAKKLKEVGADADIVYAFSSVSCGIPLILARLKKPKKILRLGGDFFWERYTDMGGKKSLRDFYASPFSLGKRIMQWLLLRFDYIVFSTEFQQNIYETSYKKLPAHSVIENALIIQNIQYNIQNTHRPHVPFRLLFMGRTVAFKNIPSLIEAMILLPDCVLTIVGEGPQDDMLRQKAEHLGLHTRVRFCAPVSGEEKHAIFASHDLLVLPSLTDISPNVALEAKAAGLRVLITNENGLRTLANKMYIHPMNSVEEVVDAINKVREQYNLRDSISDEIIHPWSAVASETQDLFATLSQ